MPRSASRALTPSRRRSGWSSTGSVPCSRSTWPARSTGPATERPEAPMAIDLTGGIDPAREYVFAQRPDDPEMRESVSFWVSDDRGRVGLTRVGIEAMAAHWEAHGLQVNVAFSDGRVFRLRQDGKTWPAAGP